MSCVAVGVLCCLPEPRGSPQPCIARAMIAELCGCLGCIKMSKNGIWTLLIALMNLISKIQKFRCVDPGTCNAPCM